MSTSDEDGLEVVLTDTRGNEVTSFHVESWVANALRAEAKAEDVEPEVIVRRALLRAVYGT